MRAARARELVASGEQPTAVARVAQISRQAIYQPPRRRPLIAGPRIPVPGDAAIVEIAKAHPTDGTRMVAAIASREFGEAVNRKRVQRIMRAHRLLQPVRGLDRRRRPGFFRVRRPDELWHMDMTKVWTAAHGWVYLHVIIDCCTREIAAWTLDLPILYVHSDEAYKANPRYGQAAGWISDMHADEKRGVLVDIDFTDEGTAEVRPCLRRQTLGQPRRPTPAAHILHVRYESEHLSYASTIGTTGRLPGR